MSQPPHNISEMASAAWFEFKARGDKRTHAELSGHTDINLEEELSIVKAKLDNTMQSLQHIGAVLHNVVFDIAYVKDERRRKNTAKMSCAYLQEHLGEVRHGRPMKRFDDLEYRALMSP